MYTNIVTQKIITVWCVIMISKGDHKIPTTPVLSLGSTDFEEIVTNHEEVVDKTLFIKTIIEEAPNKILLTAPKRFGKSTNLNMVKRFLEIQVDVKGKPIDRFKATNYKLFKKNNLKINRDKKVFNEHLGKHPVIFIDYKPLNKIDCFHSMLETFRNIQKNMFLQHKYLLSVNLLWLEDFNITVFKNYISTESDQIVDQLAVVDGFKILSQILYKHFGKPIFVLIDEYDAFVDSLMFKENPDMDRIISFIKNVNENILNNNYVDRVLVTGVLRVTGEGLSVIGNNVTEYNFLGDHTFSTYFGLTEIELEEVLRKFVKDEEERNFTRSTIVKYYDGYSTMKQIKVYSIWSILSFLHQEKEATTHWCRPEYLEKYFSIFRIQYFKDKILKLLSGNCLPKNISTPLSKHNLIILKNAIVRKNTQIDSSSTDLFIELFYHLGYLTVAETSKPHMLKCLKIPNREISYELSKVLAKLYEVDLKLNFQCVYFLHSAIDSIRSSALDHLIFENLFKSIKTLYIYGEEKSISEIEYQSSLFTFLVLEYRHTYSEGYKSSPNKYKDIFTINKHGVAFFIEIKVEKPNEHKSHKEIAESAFNQTITRDNNMYIEPSFKDQINGKVFVGICFGLNNKLKIAYSYLFEKDDAFTNPKFVPRQ